MTFNKEVFDEYLNRGLRVGKGENRESLLCVEQVIAIATGQELTDEPICVSSVIRNATIFLNDTKYWTSPEARAKGLRRLALAQLDTRTFFTTVAYTEFRLKAAIRTFKKLLPSLGEILDTDFVDDALAKIQIVTAIEQTQDKLNQLVILLSDLRKQMYNMLKPENEISQYLVRTLWTYLILSCDNLVDLTTVATHTISFLKIYSADKFEPGVQDQILTYVADAIVETLIEFGHTNEVQELWK